ncbi:ferritin-like fold-containing protein [Propionimicrobium sp. PCR01-08-3]|uniref:ferritin-like fold-containing protein n=1 Tax=Propionimicrobium sp. PCR01-08-3 TaxID=3052086 RepID=UPI00255C5841|nr:ferritin-like fold-containing protein [Propionimicrobium sp. PCR01-08-3]WIY83772.1 ferritin-like fold-containing protein [Propionimicrobium sp. PCR01-08-3]
MSTEIASEPCTALLAWLGYQNLWVAESSIVRSGSQTELADRLTVARLSADALDRCLQACDAIPGGQSAAAEKMAPIVSPVDEFWAVTKPRVQVEQRLRLMVLASVELELVQRLEDRLPEPAKSVLTSEAGLWRTIDDGGSQVADAINGHTRSADELSLYGRRLLGEVVVMAQRLLVRQPDLRIVLAGESDDELSISTAVLDEVLQSTAARLTQLGLSV